MEATGAVLSQAWVYRWGSEVAEQGHRGGQAGCEGGLALLPPCLSLLLLWPDSHPLNQL